MCLTALYCGPSCRDLKLDNTLLDCGDLGDSYPPIIKLCDFGFAKGWTGDSNMYTHIGYAPTCLPLSVSLLSFQRFKAGQHASDG